MDLITRKRARSSDAKNERVKRQRREEHELKQASSLAHPTPAYPTSSGWVTINRPAGGWTAINHPDAQLPRDANSEASSRRSCATFANAGPSSTAPTEGSSSEAAFTNTSRSTNFTQRLSATKFVTLTDTYLIEDSSSEAAPTGTPTVSVAQRLSAPPFKFISDEVTKIAVFMKTYNTRNIGDHGDEYEDLLEDLGFKNPALSTTQQKALRFKVLDKMNGLFKKMEKFGHIIGCEKGTNNITANIKFASWTAAWLLPEWNGDVTVLPIYYPVDTNFRPEKFPKDLLIVEEPQAIRSKLEAESEIEATNAGPSKDITPTMHSAPALNTPPPSLSQTSGKKIPSKKIKIVLRCTPRTKVEDTDSEDDSISLGSQDTDSELEGWA